MSSGARADVYKCAGEGPVPIYQEAPCAEGKELREFAGEFTNKKAPELQTIQAAIKSISGKKK